MPKITPQTAPPGFVPQDRFDLAVHTMRELSHEHEALSKRFNELYESHKALQAEHNKSKKLLAALKLQQSQPTILPTKPTTSDMDTSSSITPEPDQSAKKRKNSDGQVKTPVPQPVAPSTPTPSPASNNFGKKAKSTKEPVPLERPIINPPKEQFPALPSTSKDPIIPPIKYTTTRVAPSNVPTITNIDSVDVDRCSGKPPPIILKSKENWHVISGQLSDRKVNILKATSLAEGIRILVQTPSCYRTAVKHLKSLDLPFYTFRLKEEKELKVVIRGVCETIPDSQILAELLEQKFPVLAVRRMGKATRKFPMVSVQLEKTPAAQKIFQLTRLCHLTVKVEMQKSQPTQIQCHRCQSFGHGAQRCNLAPRCVKCAAPHDTADCSRNRDTDGNPKCANCGGEHTANYRGCKSFPKGPASYARILKPNPDPKTPTPTTTTLPTADILKLLQNPNILPLLELLKKLSTPTQ